MTSPTDHPYLDAQLYERRAEQRRWRTALAARYDPQYSWPVKIPGLAGDAAVIAESILRRWIDDAIERLELTELLDQVVAAHLGQVGVALFNASSFDDRYPESAVTGLLETFAVEDGRVAIGQVAHLDDADAMNLVCLHHALTVADELSAAPEA